MTTGRADGYWGGFHTIDSSNTATFKSCLTAATAAQNFLEPSALSVVFMKQKYPPASEIPKREDVCIGKQNKKAVSEKSTIRRLFSLDTFVVRQNTNYDIIILTC